MSSVDQRLAEALAAIRDRGQWRTLVPSRLVAHGRVLRDGQDLIDFSSNDYLGLARHRLLVERARAFTTELGTGSGASRLVTGTSGAHLAIEAKIAAFKGKQAALLFASGWQCNAAVIPALLAATPGAAVFTDRLIHGSMHAGLAASGMRQHRFRHNDLAHLEDLLATRGNAASARIILTESVFSMDGDRADIGALARIARQHDAFLFVDEAHATGVLGPQGAGLAAGIDGVDLIMGTFSKALGGFGAYVACSELVRDYLVNACGGFIFTTAPPPAVLGAIDAALDLVPHLDTERAHLGMLGARLRAGLTELGIDSGTSSTQIVPAIVGSEEDALALSRALATRGMLAAAIRPPTVPKGTSRLRIALRATHSTDDVDLLLAALRDLQ